jgi:hypothetical protein
MRLKSIAIAGFIGAIAATAALESPAQFGGGFPGGGMRGSRNRPESSNRDQRPPVQNNSPEQVEDRLGMLEEDLHLSADQRAAWQSYADKVNALAVDIGREREHGPLGGGQINALAQIDRAVDTARNRLTALEDIAAAAKTLYGNLTPQQKSVADPRLATIVSSLTSPAPGAERTGRQRNIP